jgi:hypothetical protein
LPTELPAAVARQLRAYSLLVHGCWLLGVTLHLANGPDRYVDFEAADSACWPRPEDAPAGHAAGV